MNPILDLIQNNVQALIILNLLWAVIVMLGTWYYMKVKGLHLPNLTDDEIKYKENHATGRSHKTALSKLGGGSKCVKVIVTKDHLYITAIFPFNLIAVYWDGIHHIPRQKIVALNKVGKNVFVKFTNTKGFIQEHELSLKQPDVFINEIEKHS